MRSDLLTGTAITRLGERRVVMSDFVLPSIRDTLRYHPRWTTRSLKPYTDELLDLWAENGAGAVIDLQLQGPTMTRFGIVPDSPRSASRIASLSDTYRQIFRCDVQVYRDSGHVFIDVPWQQDSVYLGDLLSSGEYLRSRGLPLGIGIDIEHNVVLGDLTGFPHLLVAGSEGSGRTSFLNGLVLSILMEHSPQEVELYLCGDRNTKFGLYDELPYVFHVPDLHNQVTLIREMNGWLDHRCEVLYQHLCRTIYDFNEIGGEMKHLIVVIADAGAFLQTGRDAAREELLRLGALSKSCGIHLIVSSPKPRDLRPLVSAFESRVCLRTDTMADSRLILEQNGAEKLCRRSTLFYMDGFGGAPEVLQGADVTAKEIRAVVQALMSNYRQKEGSRRRRPAFWDKLFMGMTD